MLLYSYISAKGMPEQACAYKSLITSFLRMKEQIYQGNEQV